MTILIRCHFIIALIHFILFHRIAVAFPLVTSWNEGKLHFVNYVDKILDWDPLYNVKWNFNYERYAKKLAIRCGNEDTKIETLLDANVYTSIMSDINWDTAYQEWEEKEFYGNIFPRSNLNIPAYVGCASERCDQQTYHVCVFNHYFLRPDPSGAH